MRCGAVEANGEAAVIYPGPRCAIWPASEPRASRRLDDARRTGSDRADALLLLRSAVRHPAEGEEREDHRLRAVGGVSVQQGEALSEGRQAIPAGRASRPPVDAART